MKEKRLKWIEYKGPMDSIKWTYICTVGGPEEWERNSKKERDREIETRDRERERKKEKGRDILKEIKIETFLIFMKHIDLQIWDTHELQVG